MRDGGGNLISDEVRKHSYFYAALHDCARADEYTSTNDRQPETIPVGPKQ
jgi:hypothetical protein